MCVLPGAFVKELRERARYTVTHLLLCCLFAHCTSRVLPAASYSRTFTAFFASPAAQAKQLNLEGWLTGLPF